MNRLGPLRLRADFATSLPYSKNSPTSLCDMPDRSILGISTVWGVIHVLVSMSWIVDLMGGSVGHYNNTIPIHREFLLSPLFLCSPPAAISFL